MLKSTGIVRKVDELGRIVIPIELRRTMRIDIKDALEIYVDGEAARTLLAGHGSLIHRNCTFSRRFSPVEGLY